MKQKLLCMLLASVLLFTMGGCQSSENEEPKTITLKIATPPIGLGEVPGVGETEISEMLTLAAERFNAQYTEYDVHPEALQAPDTL